MYCQMIGFLMYLMNTKTRYLIYCEHLEPVLDRSKKCSLDCYKACSEVPKGYSWLWDQYDANQKINLEGYVDSDWEGSVIDRKSTSWCYFSIGSGVISWFSRKQSYVALSTAEAEYVAACLASCEVVWLRKLLSNLFDLQMDATRIHCDN